MKSSLLLPLLLLGGSLIAGTNAAAGTCEAARLHAVSRAAVSRTVCIAQGAAHGKPVDPACATEADATLTGGFATDGCSPGDPLPDVVAALHAFEADLTALLRQTTAVDRCAAAKLRAAARRVKKEIACRRKAASTGAAPDPPCATAPNDVLTEAFNRCESRMACTTTGDAPAVVDLVSAFLAFIASRIDGTIPPPAPSDLAAVVAGATVQLTWTSPDPASGLTHARLLRRLNADPSGPEDPAASLVFAGAAESADDDLTLLLPDTTATPRVYRYAVYACDSGGNCEGAGSHAALTPTLVDALKAGGYVLHWRHASADVCADQTALGTAATTAVPDWWKSCDANCGTATARQLNAAGRAEAAAIGDAFAARGIPVGRVRTSEFCRNVETASGMDFGPAIEEIPDLTYFVYNEASRCSLTFAMLAEAPPAGTNGALIGHAGNSCPPLSALAWAEAAVYKPDGLGGATYVDRVLAGAWLSLP